MKKQNEYKIDHIAQTIIISKKFSKAAGILGTNEYDTLKQLRTDYPDYTVSLREIKKKDGKKSYANLTYDAMRTYISCMEGEESNNLVNLETVIKIAQGQAGQYAYVKTWFLKKYPNYSNVNEVA